MALGLGRSPAISAVKDDFTMSDMTHNFLYWRFSVSGSLCHEALSKAPFTDARLYCSGLRNARHGCQFGVADYQGSKDGTDPAAHCKPLRMLNWSGDLHEGTAS